MSKKKVSPHKSLCRHDVNDWAKTTLIFASPLLILALEDYSRTGDLMSAGKVASAALIQAVIGLLRKFLKESEYPLDE